MTEPLDLGHFEGHELNVDEGWWPLLARLHGELVTLWPEYRVAQVKEKWGLLRVYLDYHPADDNGAPAVSHEVMNRCEDELARYEKLSATVCEVCGEPGLLRRLGWLKTLCEEHAGGAPVIEMWAQRRAHGTHRGFGPQPDWANEVGDRPGGGF